MKKESLKKACIKGKRKQRARAGDNARTYHSTFGSQGHVEPQSSIHPPIRDLGTVQGPCSPVLFGFFPGLTALLRGRGESESG